MNVSSVACCPSTFGQWPTGTGKAQPKTRPCRRITPSSGTHCLTSSTSNSPARGCSMRAATAAASSGFWSIRGARSGPRFGYRPCRLGDQKPRRLAGDDAGVRGQRYRAGRLARLRCRVQPRGPVPVEQSPAGWTRDPRHFSRWESKCIHSNGLTRGKSPHGRLPQDGVWPRASGLSSTASATW